MSRIFTILLILTMFLSPLQSMGGRIYVSPKGNDNNPGTETQPFLTVQRALREAREWRRFGGDKTEGMIEIILGEGVYPQTSPIFIRPEDSGTGDSPTVIRGKAGENAVISGGVELKGWRQEGKLWTMEAPLISNSPQMFRQLWINGRKALRANQFGKYEMQRMIDFNIKDRTVTIPFPKEITSIEEAPQLEMMVHQRWAVAILRVKDIVRQGDNAVVSFLEPESELEFSHPWPQPVINGEKGSSSYCLMNALQFVDTPGEWYQDNRTGKIYYYPRQGETMENTIATAPALSAVMEIKGTPSQKVTNVYFKDINFEYAAWNRPAGKGHVTLQGGFPITDAYKLQQPGFPWSATLENQAWIERPEAAVTMEWTADVNFENCRFSHLASTALDMVTGNSGNIIADNRFTDIGGTAILAGSFAEGGYEVHRPYRTSKGGDEYCRNLDIKDNIIIDATNEDWGCVGIGCGFVRDVNITGNEVADVNYSGICVGWGWSTDSCGMENNKIIGNYVHRFAKQLYDAGGIYTLSNQPRSVIAQNKIDSIGRAPYATNDRGFYIYLDEATDGYTIEDNWCPEAKFGDNKPGPAVVWKNNGPSVVLKNHTGK